MTTRGTNYWGWGRALGVLGLLAMGCNDSGGTSRVDDEETAGGGTADDGADGQADDDGDDAADDDADDGGSSDDGVEEPWEPGGPDGECAIDELVPAHVYLRRVKTILTGEAPTDEEVSAVMADPAALPGFIEQWVDGQAFADKLHDYMAVTLQQAPLGRLEYVSQIQNGDGAGQFKPPNALYANLNESFVRTAVKIVTDGRPFNQIASTRTWMMTTAVMSYLLAADRRNWGQSTFYSGTYSQGGTNYNANTPLATQIANQVFYSPDAPAGCTPETSNNTSRLLSRTLGGQAGPNDCEFSTALMGPEDFNDWREVTIEALPDGEDRIPFYDVLTLHDTDTIALKSARAGFFSAPSFLAGWRTNEDNSFRVTTNQSLIVALGLAFEDSDVTNPLGDEGLADAHAEPGTQCYGCHKNLDPMRNFFDNVYYPDTYAVLNDADIPGNQPSFSFQEHTGEGNTLADFGQIVSEHPAFAAGWTQKLCYLANAQGCDTTDPEFARVAQVFEDSNYDFKTLVVTLFSSRLVTAAECPQESDVQVTQVPTSATRREHLCTLMTQRLGQDACDINNNTRDLSDALPADSWSRGSEVPNQPAQTSLFYAATTDSLCRNIGNLVVNAADSPLQSADMETSVDVLVEQVMGLAKSDPRHAEMHGLLSSHLLDAAELTGNAKKQLVSAFTLACTSPYVTSTDL